MPPCAPLMLSGRGKTMGDIDAHGRGVFDILMVDREKELARVRLAGIKAGLEAAAELVRQLGEQRWGIGNAGRIDDCEAAIRAIDPATVPAP